MISIFYNKKNLNDTLTIGLWNKEVNKQDINDKYSVLYNNNEIVGINIFNYSTYQTLPEGMLYPEDSILKKIEEITKINLKDKVNKNFVIGKILSLVKVEGTHLHYCDVQVDENTVLKIICGAKNVAVNKCVIVAMIGTFMPSGLYISKGKIQKFDSFGMLCSGKELNLTNYNNEGIILFDENQHKVGSLFKEVFSNHKNI